MKEYYLYLAEELGDAIEHFDDTHEAAHQICIALSVFGGDIPETFFRMYTECLNIDQTILRNAATYFSGMGKLKIDCDCYEDHYLCDIMRLREGPFYEMGRVAMFETDYMFVQVSNQIASILVDMKE